MRGPLNIKKENYDIIKNFVLNEVPMRESKMIAFLSLISKKGYLVNDNRTLFIALNKYELVGVDIISSNRETSILKIKTVWAEKRCNDFKICMN